MPGPDFSAWTCAEIWLSESLHQLLYCWGLLVLFITRLKCCTSCCIVGDSYIEPQLDTEVKVKAQSSSVGPGGI